VSLAVTCETLPMIDAVEITEGIPLPAVPKGWFDQGYVPLADGRLAIVRTATDIHGEHARWLRAVDAGNIALERPVIWGDLIRLSVFDGTRETDVVSIPARAYPVVDRMPDGRWVVASSRSESGEENGRIYRPDGGEERALVLGDAIEHLLCAPDGSLWVGYFDEGVFGGSHRNGSRPVSSGGIVRFDERGAALWSFNEQSRGKRLVDDCYAMTLSGNTLWACYYSDFPIVAIAGGKITSWSNKLSGAKAVAVRDDIVVLAGGYGDEADRIAIMKLEAGTARHLGNLHVSPSSRTGASMMMGRGDTLHIVGGGTWRKIPVDRAAQAVDGDR